MSATAWTTMLTAWAVAVISPGPDFLLVLRTAATSGRRAGIVAGLGIASGIAVWIVLAMTGISVFLARQEEWYHGLRLAGAAFLIGYGVRILMSSRRSQRASSAADDLTDSATMTTVRRPTVRRRRPGRAWRLGLATNLANPKAVIFFGALFTTLLPSQASALVRLNVMAVMLAMAVLWFTLVAAFASSALVVSAYRRAERAVDATVGVVFTVLGGLLIATS